MCRVEWQPQVSEAVVGRLVTGGWCGRDQVVKQYVEMDHVATTLAVSPSGYLVTIGTDERLVKVAPAPPSVA